MEVEFTARHVSVPKSLRLQAEEGMERIARILGKTARASIIFRAQRHLHIAELTIKARMHTIVATGEANNFSLALRKALVHAENQALRNHERKYERKRLPKEEKVLTAPPVTRAKTRVAEAEAAGGNGRQSRAKAKVAAEIAVHSFPATAEVVEPHILQTSEAITLKPMTVEQAVKEAEFRDRDLLIFRNLTGQLFVLHRRRDGQMELVEIP